jgi:hypothetical protein
MPRPRKPAIPKEGPQAFEDFRRLAALVVWAGKPTDETKPATVEPPKRKPGERVKRRA